jgi:DMSO/TMAO reductase YedYZ molybdopterin-dependent catalytic subunit
MKDGTPVGRRVVLGMLGLGALGVAFGSRAATTEANLLRPLQSGGGVLSQLIPGGSSWRYYSIVSSNPTPTVSDYQLKISGLVHKPMTFTYAQLAAMPQTTLVRDFQCVTGWRVPSVPWTGVLLRDLLDQVGVDSSATALHLTSLDGAYTESLTLEQAHRSDILVALTMYGKTVPVAHGGPVRLYVAPMYGYKSLKWLGGIELVTHVEPGFWEQNGYDVDAWVGRSNGRTDAPIA